MTFESKLKKPFRRKLLVVRGDSMKGMAIEEVVILLVILAILVLVGITGYARMTTKATCLKAGYAEYEIDYHFNRYCVQRDYRGVMKAIPLEDI